jgi:hypothetical protein
MPLGTQTQKNPQTQPLQFILKMFPAIAIRDFRDDNGFA